MKRFFQFVDRSSRPAAIPRGQRVYAIGDIHGRFDLLHDLLGQIETDSAQRPIARETVVILGDFIDRGPDSAKIIEGLAAFDPVRRSHSTPQQRLVVLKGNHEATLLDALAGDYDAAEMWLEHGGLATLQSFGADTLTVDIEDTGEMIQLARAAIPPLVIAWLARLPISFSLGGYFFVHAGVKPGVAIAHQSETDLLWIRREFLESEDSFGPMVVHGHSISEEGVVMRPNRIGVDTGAYRTGRLSAIGLEGSERWALATGGT